MDKIPEKVFVISGKRKSGKDYVASLMCNRIGKHLCSSVQLSGPLKKQYAEDHNLNFEKLMDSSEYKEKFRIDMIKWGEDKRTEDPGFFCRLATSKADLKKIWIITDARRKTDVDYFKENYNDRTLTVRVCAKESIRKSRGFTFTLGVDDAESECGLDEGIHWDYLIHNNGDQDLLDKDINHLVTIVQEKLCDVT
ncbi:phosphomevalonate kinase-like isoform X1 [Mytilus galloprovincialis]|uniref:Phosphomevalonate kinase n=1 Tax=Mytilus galloprovincialis TaxID=29158 RepID=A0A8B6GYC6_MYTGA|nr:phosphomevalonate kinase [Mytilus galloprovincialis]